MAFPLACLDETEVKQTKKPSPGDKNVISSAPSVLPAPLPSRRRLGLCLLCQETQQQNLKPPQLLPPLSPSSLPMISDFGKEADPSSVSRVKLGHFLLRFIWVTRSPSRCTSFLLSLLFCVCVHTEGLAGISLPAPQGGPCRPEWSRFTMWEIRGAAADKGISRPSGAVHAGRVTSVAGPAARRP